MLRTDEPFGLVRASTERLAMEAAMAGRKNATWPQLWPEVVGKIKDGDSLRGTETRWLHDYLVAKGRFDLIDDDEQTVQTVQLPRDWAASVLAAGDRGAERAIRGLQEVGLIEKVHDGIKGHAALFAVMPLPPERPDEPP